MGDARTLTLQTLGRLHRFEVKDSPRQLLGSKTQNFQTFDTGKLTAAFNDWLAPEENQLAGDCCFQNYLSYRAS
jgi:hypothetical protein